VIPRVALAALPPDVAVIVEVTGLDPAAVLTVKTAAVAPGETTIEVGSVAEAELEVRLTTKPPEPAGLLRMTVPVENPPAITMEGVRLRLIGAWGLTASDAVAVVPPEVAETVDDVAVLTLVVDAENVALVAPPGTCR
jgi:hypothetical protein